MKKLIFVLLFAACTPRAPSVADAGTALDAQVESCRNLENELCKKVVECSDITEFECKKQFDPANECLQSNRLVVDTCLADVKKLVCSDSMPDSCLFL